MKNKKKTTLIVIAISSIFLCSYGITYGKYISNSVWNYYLNSKGFYFSSDYLDITPIKNVNTNWDGTSTHLNIKNNLNQSIISNYDINYHIVCNIEGEASDYTICKINGTNSNEYNGTLSHYESCINETNDQVDTSTLNQIDCELSNYKWNTHIAEQDLYFDIVKTEENYELNNVTVTITATSISPYRKTISGIFSLQKSTTTENQLAFNYLNHNNYDSLIITNYSLSDKCVSISLSPTNLRIDTDNNNILTTKANENNYINQITTKVLSKDTTEYIFYSQNNNMYDISQLNINEIECIN